MRNALRHARALLLAIAAVPLAAQPYPEKPADGIADLAGVLTPADADGVRSAIARMRLDPGVEVHVLTVQRIPAGTPDPEAFATAVYNRWRLGLGYPRDGVLVMVAVDDRFTRIELGDGAPAGMEPRMQGIVDSVMIPRFRQGEVSGGVREAVLAIASAYGAPASAAPPPATRAPRTEPYYVPPQRRSRDIASDELHLSAGALLLILVLGAGMAGAGAYLYQRSQKQRCAHCGGRLVRLDEHAEDAHLDDGRRLEEELGSVRHDVWRCTGCGTYVARSDPRLTRHDRCTECGYRTVDTTRTMVQKPTYESGGSERVETKCAHCGWGRVEVIDLPRRERRPRREADVMDEDEHDSGWSGGGRSGRGAADGSSGGSSSGRGAGGRW